MRESHLVGLEMKFHLFKVDCFNSNCVTLAYAGRDPVPQKFTGAWHDERPAPIVGDLHFDWLTP